MRCTSGGKSVLVIDRRNHIAGNLYCESKDDINIRVYGAHIFHTSLKHVWDYVNQFAEFNHYVNSPVANYKRRDVQLPFNMNTFSKMSKNLEEQVKFCRVRILFMKKLIKGYAWKNNGAVNVQSYQLSLLNDYLCVIHTIITILMIASKGFLWVVIPKMIERMLEGIEVRLVQTFSNIGTNTKAGR